MAHPNISDVRMRCGGHGFLEGIDLAIADGEFLIPVGSSGCGETTLLNMIAGSIRSPTARSRSAIAASTGFAQGSRHRDGKGPGPYPAFFFDEPLSNLGAKLREEMRAEIKALHQRLLTTVAEVTTIMSR